MLGRQNEYHPLDQNKWHMSLSCIFWGVYFLGVFVGGNITQYNIYQGLHSPNSVAKHYSHSQKKYKIDLLQCFVSWCIGKRTITQWISSTTNTYPVLPEPSFIFHNPQNTHTHKHSSLSNLTQIKRKEEKKQSSTYPKSKGMLCWEFC